MFKKKKKKASPTSRREQYSGSSPLLNCPELAAPLFCSPFPFSSTPKRTCCPPIQALCRTKEPSPLRDPASSEGTIPAFSCYVCIGLLLLSECGPGRTQRQLFQLPCDACHKKLPHSPPQGLGALLNICWAPTVDRALCQIPGTQHAPEMGSLPALMGLTMEWGRRDTARA